MWLRESHCRTKSSRRLISTSQYKRDSSRRLIPTRWVVNEKSVQDIEPQKADIKKMGLNESQYRMLKKADIYKIGSGKVMTYQS